MSFLRPTFSEIFDRVKADIDSRLAGADSKLRRSVLSVLAFVVSGVAHSLYGFLNYISLQAFPDTAEIEYLNRWGSIWGVTRLEAVKSTGISVATGTNGTLIEEGQELQRSDGVLFKTTADATISSGTANLNIEAVTANLAGNTEAESILSFISPPDGIDSNTTVDVDGITGGTDDETDENYLTRILLRIQEPPHGGKETDYEAWSLENSGVTRAWVYPLENGVGTVTVRFMMDNTYDDGIPLSGDVDTVQAYIDERRPATAEVTVVAPVPITRNFTIHLNVNDTAAIRTAVEAELKDMIIRDGEPGATLYLSRINEAISIATGEFDHTLTSPNANVTYSAGQIPVMGTITWT